MWRRRDTKPTLVVCIVVAKVGQLTPTGTYKEIRNSDYAAKFEKNPLKESSDIKFCNFGPKQDRIARLLQEGNFLGNYKHAILFSYSFAAKFKKKVGAVLEITNCVF